MFHGMIKVKNKVMAELNHNLIPPIYYGMINC